MKHSGVFGNIKAAVKDNSHRVKGFSPRYTCRQMRIVQVHRADSDHDAVHGMPDPVNVRPGGFSGDPLGISRTGGRPAVQGRRAFGDDKWAFGGDVFVEKFVEPVRPVPADAPGQRHPFFLQEGGSVAPDIRVGIIGGHHHPLDS